MVVDFGKSLSMYVNLETKRVVSGRSIKNLLVRGRCLRLGYCLGYVIAVIRDLRAFDIAIAQFTRCLLEI